MGFFAQRSRSLKAYKSQKRKDHPLEDAYQTTQTSLDTVDGCEHAQVIMRANHHDHGDRECKDNADFNGSQDNARVGRKPNSEVRQGKYQDVAQDRVDPPGNIDTCEGLNERFGVHAPDEGHHWQQERLSDENTQAERNPHLTPRLRLI